jgi:hypothetical protein
MLMRSRLGLGDPGLQNAGAREKPSKHKRTTPLLFVDSLQTSVAVGTPVMLCKRLSRPGVPRVLKAGSRQLGSHVTQTQQHLPAAGRCGGLPRLTGPQLTQRS